MRVLLVEDDAMIAAAVARALRDAAYAVDYVDNGSAALSALDILPYDLVLLDLGLPGLDGLQVLQRLRQGGGNRAPLIIVTARDHINDRLAGLDCGADDYLIKPFDMPELRHACVPCCAGMVATRVSRSLQTRLSMWLTLLTLAVGTIGCGVSFYGAHQDANEFQDDLLRQVALLLSAPAASVAPPGKLDAGDAESQLLIQAIPANRALHLGNEVQALPPRLGPGLITLGGHEHDWRVLVWERAHGDYLAVSQRTDLRDELAGNSA